MKTTIFYLSFLIIIFSSCTTTYNTYNYSDPNYLEADEFTIVSEAEKATIVIIEEEMNIDTINYNESTTGNNYNF